jgi:hypothetical protein
MEMAVTPAQLEVREVYQGPGGYLIVVAQLLNGHARSFEVLRSVEEGDRWLVRGGGVLAERRTLAPPPSRHVEERDRGIETFLLERIDGTRDLRIGERLRAES